MSKRKNTGKPKIELQKNFKSFEEFMAHVKQAPDMSESEAASIQGPNSFTGTKSYEEALKLAKQGCNDTAAKVKRAYQEMKIVQEKEMLYMSEAYNYSTEGYFFDTGTFLEGNPEYWLQPEMTKGCKQVIRLYINIVAPASYSEADFFKKGAAVVNMIEILENNNYPVELYAVVSVKPSNGSEDKFQITICLKEAGVPLDFAKIAFVFAHRSFFRRLMFRAMEKLPQNIRDKYGIHCFGGYGHPSEYSDSTSGAVIFEFNVSNYATSPKEYFKNVFKSHGIVIE